MLLQNGVYTLPFETLQKQLPYYGPGVDDIVDCEILLCCVRSKIVAKISREKWCSYMVK